MLNLDYLSINEKNHLSVSGCDAVELALKFGTPLYIIDENQIRKNCNIYKMAIKKYYDNNGCVAYASKALNCMEICRIMNSEGCFMDVVSGGELYTAIRSGFPTNKIFFHGNNKTYDELVMSVEHHVGKIIVDNFTELETLNKISAKKNVISSVLLRIKPNVEAHTHHYITTGQIDSKFGFAIDTGDAFRAVKETMNYKNLNFYGFSYHIGSQIFSVAPFMYAAEIVMRFINDVTKALNINVEELDIGGGFGIKYTNTDDTINYEEFLFKIFEVIRNNAKKYDIKMPYIYIEPGRSIVGDAGVTLYKVGAIKNIPDVRTYVCVDGGMTDNPRFALYNAKYTAINASNVASDSKKLVTLAGKCCESGDILGENLLISSPKIGDILAVLCTGAYNYSMASNYNKNLKPAMIIIKNTIPRIAIKRQSYADLLVNEL